MIPPTPTLYSSPSTTKTSRWNTRWLIYSHILVVVMLFTLFFPPTKALWRILDTAFFNLINPSLDGPTWWQNFWAMANHKYADLLEDFIFLCFLIAFVMKGHRFVRMRRIAEVLICTIYSVAIFYFFNRVLIRHHLHFYWPSPSAVLDSAVHLSDKVSWISIKDSSKKCFPGDHATTALLFATFYAYLERGPLAKIMALYAAFLCLPRLITGAHWFSDIFVGTNCIVIFFLSWLFFSPLFEIATAHVEKLFIGIGSLFKKQKSYG